ncbi:MAG: hypothetical protein ABSG91_06475 [Syntrophobacteraceae bacterium]|jgi:hypothetical protein
MPEHIYPLFDLTPAAVQYVFSENKVNPDEFFQSFPDLLISSFRKQMLLGKVPAGAVQRILGPLLYNFYELMLQLPPHLQTDVENILRIYPEVAERFGVLIKPPILESLRCFAKYRLGLGSIDTPADLQFDYAAESQQKLEGAKRSFVKEGQGFFTTDKGNSVYLEFFYSVGDDCASFEYKPLKFEIEIHICGVYTATLGPRRPKQKIQVNDLFEILMKGARGVNIKTIELSPPSEMQLPADSQSIE